MSSHPQAKRPPGAVVLAEVAVLSLFAVLAVGTLALILRATKAAKDDAPEVAAVVAAPEPEEPAPVVPPPAPEPPPPPEPVAPTPPPDPPTPPADRVSRAEDDPTAPVLEAFRGAQARLDRAGGGLQALAAGLDAAAGRLAKAGEEAKAAASVAARKRSAAEASAKDEVNQARVESETVAWERDQLRRKLAKSRDEWQKAKDPNRYAVLPFAAPDGTIQVPVVIECVAEGVEILPDGGFFALDSIDPGPYRDSPFLIELQKLKGKAKAGSFSEAADQPSSLFVFFAVRTGGIKSYYEARAALDALRISFGYELVDDHWSIEAGKPATPEEQPEVAPRRERAPVAWEPEVRPKGVGGGRIPDPPSVPPILAERGLGFGGAPEDRTGAGGGASEARPGGRFPQASIAGAGSLAGAPATAGGDPRLRDLPGVSASRGRMPGEPGPLHESIVRRGQGPPSGLGTLDLADAAGGRPAPRRSDDPLQASEAEAGELAGSGAPGQGEGQGPPGRPGQQGERGQGGRQGQQGQVQAVPTRGGQIGRPGQGGGQSGQGAAGPGQPGIGTPGAGEGRGGGGGGGLLDPRPNRTLEMVVVCGPEGLLVRPTGLRVSKATLDGPKREWIEHLQKTEHLTVLANPRFRVNPFLKFVVEPGGQAAYWQAVGQLRAAGINWPSRLESVEFDRLRFFDRGSR